MYIMHKMQRGEERMYKRLLEGGIQVKIIGDGIAAGSGSSDDNRGGPVILTVGGMDFREQLGRKCWASLFAAYVRGLYPASRVKNRSCSRLDSEGLRENIGRFTDEEDRLVLLMIGAHDRKLADGEKRLEENVKYILDYFEGGNKKVLLMSYPPSAADHESRLDRFFCMADVDRILREAAESRGIPFISHYRLLAQYYQEQQLSVEDVMLEGRGKRDGLHPSDLVHHLIFEQIVHVMEH